MKQLNDLFMRDRFKVPGEEVKRKLKERLKLTDEEVKRVANTVFVVVVKYRDDWIRVGATNTASEIKLMKKLNFPGDLAVIPER